MVWFQCESCGDNLKKPKLQGHFQQCAAHRLSCIDCGVVFDRQSVQAHTSCVTEEVRYGPRDAFRQALANPGDGAKEGPAKPAENLELTIGLTTRPPWECSLCRVKCTSQETLQGHAQGKKHRAKARTAAKAQMEKEGPVEGAGKEQAVAKTDGNAEPPASVGAAGKGLESRSVAGAANGEAGAVEKVVEKASKRKRKNRETGEEGGETGGKSGTGAVKDGKKWREEGSPGQGAEVIADAGLNTETKKEKKKGKKQKIETGLDNGAIEGKVATAGDAENGVIGEKANGAPGKKGKKRKDRKGDDKMVDGEKEEWASVGVDTAAPEVGRKPGKGKKGLDEKQYWEELAEKGRKKKEEDESPAGATEEEGAGGGSGQPSEEPPRKNKRKAASGEEGDAAAGEGKGKGKKRKGGSNVAPDEGRAETAVGGPGSEREAEIAEKGTATEVVAVKPGKLRKLMAAALQEAPKRTLSVKKLVRSVLTQPVVGDAVPKDALRQQVLLESATSSKFRIEGGKVSLVTDT